MNTNQRVHAAIKLNGQMTSLGEVELKHVPIMLARFIMETDLDTRSFSTLELRIGKRPIHWSTGEEDLLSMLDPTIELELVNDSEPIDDQKPIITYAELAELNLDNTWTQYVSLKRESNVAALTGPEIDSIKSNWQRKYAATKYARLVR